MGRLPQSSMAALAIVLLVAAKTGSFTRAGLAVAVWTIGAGISNGPKGRALDRFGDRAVLPGTAVGFLACMSGMCVLPPASGWFMAVTALAGITLPPIQSSIRALLGRLPTESQRAAAYAADATTQEISYMAGPAIAAGLAAWLGSWSALVGSGLLAVVGSVLLANAAGHLEHRERGASHRSRLWAALWPLLVAGFLLVAGLQIIELVVIAHARLEGHAAASGVLISLWSLGSLIGGTVIGPSVSREGKNHLPVLVLATSAGFALLALAAGLYVLVVLLMVGGVAIAPTMAALNARTARLVPKARAAEAFGWMGTAFLAGGAAGAALGGATVEHLGVSAGYLAAAAITVPAALFAMAGALKKPGENLVGQQDGAGGDGEPSVTADQQPVVTEGRDPAAP